ncbi:MAG: branched-chain amino acid ABC transporter permease [Rubrivivax sp. SCN 71-131]|jgi:predicted branched-subunit amino acid permease|nr:MAG: branched-chain amino acid ABC transporter permease [Rubrivivax sp. SCN 71-131]
MHALRAWLSNEYVRLGARDMTAPSIGIAAWGLVTGVAMVKSGLSIPVALTMSLLMFAASAQLATIPLLAAGAPVGVMLAAATCVNLRFVVLSAQWRPYFGALPRAQRMRLAYFAADLNYVQFVHRFPEPVPRPEQLPYFWGGVAINWISWQLLSVAGVLLGERVPAHWGLDFAGPLVLIGVVGSMLVDRATWVAAGVAAAVSVLAYALPLKLNVLAAIVAAVAAGLLVDHRSTRTVLPLDDRT